MPEIRRRSFLTAAAGAFVAPWNLIVMNAAPKIPRRRLGRTGLQVSILGLGGGSQFLAACKTDEEAVELLTTALDGGITYFDSAWDYGAG